MADRLDISEEALERLATLIAESLARDRQAARNSHSSGQRDSWLPSPVRPEPPARGGEPPVWSGASQSLAGVAPGPDRTPDAGRSVSVAELSNATRAAAAGKGPAPAAAPASRSPRTGFSGSRARSVEVGIGVSNRHVHLSERDARTLFGSPLTAEHAISQPGQFAAHQTVAVEGPRGRLDGVRVVGPARAETQVELARSDARRIGVRAPVAASGSLATSAGGVTLHGTAGSVRLEKGVIVAGRHLHLSESDARAWGLADGDILDVRCGAGSRAVTFHGVLVRAGAAYATELHVDVDEANAAALETGDRATITAWHGKRARRRRLVTEREVIEIARRGDRIPAGALLTPSALDRARALGLPIS